MVFRKTHGLLCIGLEGVPVDKSPGKECEPEIVFESLDLSENEWICLDIHVSR